MKQTSEGVNSRNQKFAVLHENYHSHGRSLMLTVNLRLKLVILKAVMLRQMIGMVNRVQLVKANKDW
jgi:hypothetical protein